MKVEFVNLDEETVRKAETYLPLAEKYGICKILAQGCVEKVEEGAQSPIPMPERWQESLMGKRMVLMYALVGVYLKLVDVQELYATPPSFSFSVRQYDQFSQVFSQLERLKRSKDDELRSIAYALLADYKDFERVLNTEIANILYGKNDVCKRIFSMIAMQTQPEALQSAMEELKKVSSELESQQKAHAKIVGRAGKGA